MPQTKVPAIETYREALSELTNAVNALDMAHALLKDINLDKYIQSSYATRREHIKYAVDLADSLLLDLQNVKCEECGRPMAESEDCLSGDCPSLKENK